MSKRSIHIDRLQIRLPRGAAGVSREIAAGLGNDVLWGLSEATKGRRGTFRVDEVSAGRVVSTGRADAESIRKLAAERIAAELAKRFE